MSQANPNNSLSAIARTMPPPAAAPAVAPRPLPGSAMPNRSPIAAAPPVSRAPAPNPAAGKAPPEVNITRSSEGKGASPPAVSAAKEKADRAQDAARSAAAKERLKAERGGVQTNTAVRPDQVPAKAEAPSKADVAKAEKKKGGRLIPGLVLGAGGATALGAFSGGQQAMAQQQQAPSYAYPAGY
jgi:hypothetical protein